MVYGVKKANGEFILILDGDGRLSKDFVEKPYPSFKKISQVSKVHMFLVTGIITSLPSYFL